MLIFVWQPKIKVHIKCPNVIKKRGHRKHLIIKIIAGTDVTTEIAQNANRIFSAAVPAAFTLFVHHRDKHGKWDDNPKPLKTFMLTGCFIQLAGVCGFVTYLTLAITSKQGKKIHWYPAFSPFPTIFSFHPDTNPVIVATVTFNPFPNKTWFLHTCLDFKSFLKHCGKRRNCSK